MFAAADHCFGGSRVLGIVQIAEDGEVRVRINGKSRVYFLAQNLCLFQAKLSLVGYSDGALGLEMCRDERERVVCVPLNIDFRKTSADAEAAAIQQKIVIRVRATR